jgi:hypothetical protein
MKAAAVLQSIHLPAHRCCVTSVKTEGYTIRGRQVGGLMNLTVVEAFYRKKKDKKRNPDHPVLPLASDELRYRAARSGLGGGL